LAKGFGISILSQVLSFQDEDAVQFIQMRWPLLVLGKFFPQNIARFFQR
jgi:hypothetical protein